MPALATNACGVDEDESAIAANEDRVDRITGRARRLRGAGRANLPPYGLSWVLKETPRPHDLVLVEGLMDVHHLRAREITNVVALGGTTVRSATFDLLARLGFQTVSISLDRDDAGRVATAQAVEHA